MRLRLVIYASASLLLLAFHAPLHALASIVSSFRESKRCFPASLKAD